MKIDNSTMSYLEKIKGLNTLDSYLEKTNKDNNSIFSDIFKEAIEAVNKTDAEDKASNMGLLSGNFDNLHTLMINAEKADIALGLTIQIRNKVIEAYNEVMRMQI